VLTQVCWETCSCCAVEKLIYDSEVSKLRDLRRGV
jgi:hypothetical protein